MLSTISKYYILCVINSTFNQYFLFICSFKSVSSSCLHMCSVITHPNAINFIMDSLAYVMSEWLQKFVYLYDWIRMLILRSLVDLFCSLYVYYKGHKSILKLTKKYMHKGNYNSLNIDIINISSSDKKESIIVSIVNLFLSFIQVSICLSTVPVFLSWILLGCMLIKVNKIIRENPNLSVINKQQSNIARGNDVYVNSSIFEKFQYYIADIVFDVKDNSMLNNRSGAYLRYLRGNQSINDCSGANKTAIEKTLIRAMKISGDCYCATPYRQFLTCTCALLLFYIYSRESRYFKNSTSVNSVLEIVINNKLTIKSDINTNKLKSYMINCYKLYIINMYDTLASELKQKVEDRLVANYCLGHSAISHFRRREKVCLVTRLLANCIRKAHKQCNIILIQLQANKLIPYTQTNYYKHFNKLFVARLLLIFATLLVLCSGFLLIVEAESIQTIKNLQLKQANRTLNDKFNCLFILITVIKSVIYICWSYVVSVSLGLENRVWSNEVIEMLKLNAELTRLKSLQQIKPTNDEYNDTGNIDLIINVGNNDDTQSKTNFLYYFEMFKSESFIQERRHKYARYLMFNNNEMKQLAVMQSTFINYRLFWNYFHVDCKFLYEPIRSSYHGYIILMLATTFVGTNKLNKQDITVQIILLVIFQTGLMMQTYLTYTMDSKIKNIERGIFALIAAQTEFIYISGEQGENQSSIEHIVILTHIRCLKRLWFSASKDFGFDSVHKSTSPSIYGQQLNHLSLYLLHLRLLFGITLSHYVNLYFGW